MVRVLAHTTHNPSSNPTIYIFKYQRWALGHLGPLCMLIKLSYFFDLSTTFFLNYFFI